MKELVGEEVRVFAAQARVQKFRGERQLPLRHAARKPNTDPRGALRPSGVLCVQRHVEHGARAPGTVHAVTPPGG